ncbi:MAG: zinc ribbon domain-containing protein [Clostridia bacterium]|nr:zinc ribbon domain-containing protein [Clostridia bacterium]
MFCTKCGKELFDEAVMCPQCGTPTSNFDASINQSDEISVDTSLSRTPDVKIMYHVGEIGDKFPMKLNLEFGDFFFEEDELVIEGYVSAAKVKSGTMRGKYSDFKTKTLYSKMLFNKFKVLVIENGNFVISVYGQDGFMGKQVDNMLSSGAQGTLSEYNAVISKVEKIEKLLKEKIGGNK